VERQATQWAPWWGWYVGLTHQVGHLFFLEISLTHFVRNRIGGGTWAFRRLRASNSDIIQAAGTRLQASQCPSSGSGGISNCYGAFLGLHLTSQSTAYLEVNSFTNGDLAKLIAACY